MMDSWMNIAETLMRNTQKLLATTAIIEREIITLSRAVLALKCYCGFRWYCSCICKQV